MEKLCIMSGLSMKRWGLVEKRGLQGCGRGTEQAERALRRSSRSML